jgi:hypothetical protein
VRHRVAVFTTRVAMHDHGVTDDDASPSTGGLFVIRDEPIQVPFFEPDLDDPRAPHPRDPSVRSTFARRRVRGDGSAPSACDGQ